MANNKLFSFDYFPAGQRREEFFKNVLSEQSLTGRITSQYILLSIFTFAYGVVMGSYHSIAQAFAAGLKMWGLFTLTIIICFPAFFIIQFMLGSRLKLSQMLSIILSGFVLAAAIMISFAPIAVFFILTGSDYYFLQFLHIGIFVVGGLFGMKAVVDALKYSCEVKNIYPKTGVVIFRFWVIILAFVGIQLAWNLRPFLGDRGEGFNWFRSYEGNFYEALIYSADQLLGKNGPANLAENKKLSETDRINDSLLIHWESLGEDNGSGQ